MNHFQNSGEKKLTDLIRSATNFELSDEARQRTRGMLREYARMKPIRHPTTLEVKNSWRWFSFHMHPMPIMAAVLIIVLGGGTAFAAERALPGDMLYDIKVSVNEPLIGALSISTEAKASWAIERAERRIEEAAALALSGSLDEKSSNDLSARLETHVAEAEVEQAELEKSDALAAARVKTNLRAALLAHADILSDVSAEVEDIDTRARIDTVIERISSRALASARTHEEEGDALGAIALAVSIHASSENGDDEDVEESRSVARNRIETSERLVVRNEGRMREDTRSRLRARLTDAKSTFAEAENARSRGDKKGANSRYNRALQGAIETRAFLATRANSEQEQSTEPQTDTSAASINIETPVSDTGATISVSTAATTTSTTSIKSSSGSGRDEDENDINVEIEIKSDDDDSHKSKGKIQIDL